MYLVYGRTSGVFAMLLGRACILFMVRGVSCLVHRQASPEVYLVYCWTNDISNLAPDWPRILYVARSVACSICLQAGHIFNKWLTTDVFNILPGQDIHAFGTLLDR